MATEEKYRKKGFGKLLLKTAEKIINNVFDNYTTQEIIDYLNLEGVTGENNIIGLFTKLYNDETDSNTKQNYKTLIESLVNKIKSKDISPDNVGITKLCNNMEYSELKEILCYSFDSIVKKEYKNQNKC